MTIITPWKSRLYGGHSFRYLEGWLLILTPTWYHHTLYQIFIFHLISLSSTKYSIKFPNVKFYAPTQLVFPLVTFRVNPIISHTFSSLISPYSHQSIQSTPHFILSTLYNPTSIRVTSHHPHSIICIICPLLTLTPQLSHLNHPFQHLIY